jgi:hypothetical protein
MKNSATNSNSTAPVKYLLNLPPLDLDNPLSAAPLTSSQHKRKHKALCPILIVSSREAKVLLVKTVEMLQKGKEISCKEVQTAPNA